MKWLAIYTLLPGPIYGSLRDLSKPDLISRTLNERQDGNGTKLFDLAHDSGGYFVEISLGKSQTLKVQLRSDTYYSWVPASNASACDDWSCTHGTFNIDLSSTYAPSTERIDFATVAVPGTTGIWFTDDLNVGNLSTVNLTMGLAYDLVNPYGALGLQYKPPSDTKAVWSVMTQMVSQGALVTQAYSLSVGSVDAETGSILFGAIDTEKYTGDLMSLNAYHVADTDYRTVVTLASVQANSSSGSDELTDGLPVSIGIWIGRQGLFLPPALAFDMWAIAGAEYWSELSAATVPCAMKDSGGSFTFTLGSDQGPEVTIPMRNLVAPQSGLGDNCIFLVKNETDPANFYFGEAFLQNVYAVFDLANKKVALATPRPDSTDSNIVPFSSSAAPIPSTVSVAGQLTRPITTSPTMTQMPATTKLFSAAAGFQSTSATTTAAGYTPTVESESSTMNSTTVGIGVGVGVGGAALVAIGAAFFIMRRRRSKKPVPVSEKPMTPSSPSTGIPAPSTALSIVPSTSPGEYATELDSRPGAVELPSNPRAVEVNAEPFQSYQGGSYVELPSSSSASPPQRSDTASTWGQR